MSELAIAEQPALFDPHLPYSAENYPPFMEQYGFFRHALLEAADQKAAARDYKGPLFENFRAILARAHASLIRLDPSLTPEALTPNAYQDTNLKVSLANKPSIVQKGIKDIKTIKTQQIDSLIDSRLLGQISTQHIAPAAFDTPPYTRQGDDWNNLWSARACANACFRMVFGGIAGWVPNERVVGQNLLQHHGSGIVADSEYHKLLKTPVFSEICSKRVSVLDIIGADLRCLETTAIKIRRQVPAAQLYCVVSLASATSNRDIWHANVILEADDSAVTVHDPSGIDGLPHKRIPKDDFVRRWAMALNRAQIYVAAP